MAWNTPEDWSYKEAPGSTKLNEQIRDNLNYLKESMPAGIIMPYAGSAAPTQWLICDGSAVSRSTYSALFTAIGTTYGAGDESTTFNLPNTKGKVLVGKNASETEFDVLGETGGEKTHTLTSDEMPSHTHVQDAHTHNVNLKNDYYNDDTSFGGTKAWKDNGTMQSPSGYIASATATNQNTGGGSAHNNLPPYITINYIIKY